MFHGILMSLSWRTQTTTATHFITIVIELGLLIAITSSMMHLPLAILPLLSHFPIPSLLFPRITFQINFLKSPSFYFWGELT